MADDVYPWIPMPLDLNSLTKPIEGETPVGADLRLETGLTSLYFRLKDARAQARTTERTAEGAGDPISVPPEWATVRALAIEALETRTKDLEVASWLLEAQLRLEGFVGMTGGFDLVRELTERFWPDIHSIDEDDLQGRISPIAGLNGIGGEGALVQPIRMLPLLPDSSYGNNALWHWTRVQKNVDADLSRDFNDARASAGITAIHERAMQAGAARDAFADMTATLDRVCAAAAPPSSHVRNVLDEVLDAYRLLLGGGIEIPRGEGRVAAEAKVEADAAAAASAVAEASAAPSPAPPPQPRLPQAIETREQAFTELLRIAEFFRRTEPHSPISYALETLVRRGRLSFVDLLAELLPNADARKQLLQHAGIQAMEGAKTP